MLPETHQDAVSLCFREIFAEFPQLDGKQRNQTVSAKPETITRLSLRRHRKNGNYIAGVSPSGPDPSDWPVLRRIGGGSRARLNTVGLVSEAKRGVSEAKRESAGFASVRDTSPALKSFRGAAMR